MSSQIGAIIGINYKTGFRRAGCIHLHVINHLLNIIINSA